MSYPRHLCDQCSKAMRCVKSQKGCTAGDFSCFVNWLDDPAGTVKADLIHTERIIRSADKLQQKGQDNGTDREQNVSSKDDNSSKR